ncbi:CarD family transcriptional regulator [Clostridium sp.]|uniref:CarD family transcriptional regulator n=1 Tax=Clostridium sp. TaxID=1506 RepID=UPI00260FA0F8|nr:CarD family transcriptional regulator [Clostridium sp.]
MFKVDDYIMYGRTGVCQVTEIKDGESMGNTGTNYYVLNPVFENNSVIMTPVNNQKILMREVISKKEILSIIDSVSNEEILWIEDDKARNEKFKSSIKAGICEDWIRMIKSINLKIKEKKSVGKKISQVDEVALKEVKKLLYEEFSLALEILPEEVESYIYKRIG